VKFQCERDVLVEALGTAGRATASRGGALPVLAGIHTALQDGALTLTGHDLELTISVTITDGVNGREDGVAVLPSRLVSDVVKSLPAGAVEVEVDGDQARITAGRSEFSLRVFPVDEFPRLPEPEGDAVTLDASEPTGCASSPPTRTGWRCATCPARACSARGSRCWCRRGRSTT
jgi:DNA polymerase-3 subunit beta